ncbi:Biotin--protein ligase [Lasiodiplodia theobromae]|uniref:Biotin--protein ligase n=1 Tax=Lasiodiplodia theobromae TaxID=45133 RepID=A0A5N5CXP4_9PEZI|nr:Biotin--protein ligase [Lasiodiplodia theobromae]
MASKRTNVLVYTGSGSAAESVRHCMWTLRRLLSPNYAVVPIDSTALIQEPWSTSCALLVMPGGADLSYCRTLNGEGNRRITQYVKGGGNYLGFCAGGYYACARCEFEVGGEMEVVGDRELAFYPGVCRGLAFPGFVYRSEAGARAVRLEVNKKALAGSTVPETFRCYYNGGGVFVDAKKFEDCGVEILASYTEQLRVDSGEGAAAIVYRKVGEGGVILTGLHPEFAAVNLTKGADVPGYGMLVKALEDDDKRRTDFITACLMKLGLRVNTEPQAVPYLSYLHLTSANPSDVAQLVASWRDIITTLEDGQEYIKDEHDTFHLGKSMGSLSQHALAGVSEESDKTDDSSGNGDRILDYDKAVKHVVVHESDRPSSKETPYWNHDTFFSNLDHYQAQSRNSHVDFGRYLLYGEVVTSTSTMIEKNPALLKYLPSGFTATATTQVAARGRGTNVWVAPPGALMFTTVLRHPITLSHAPIVFIQYVAAMAIVSAVQTYEPGYEKLPIRLKWPNDIYALDPSSHAFISGSSPSPSDHVKISGVLVNSSYQDSEFTVVVGVGFNLANAAPTTSVDALAKVHGLPPVKAEKLLACIMTRFQELYTKFCRDGWDAELQEMYYRLWLHQDQVVVLENEGGIKAQIKGITSDWGLLLVEELGWEDRKTGKMWALQSDSNSFDFFKGLLKRKA